MVIFAPPPIFIRISAPPYDDDIDYKYYTSIDNDNCPSDNVL